MESRVYVYARRGNFNQNKIISCFDYLKNKDIPSWIVIFPEGTRHDPQSSKLLEKNREFITDKSNSDRWKFHRIVVLKRNSRLDRRRRKDCYHAINLGRRHIVVLELRRSTLAYFHSLFSF